MYFSVFVLESRQIQYVLEAEGILVVKLQVYCPSLVTKRKVSHVCLYNLIVVGTTGT